MTDIDYDMKHYDARGQLVCSQLFDCVVAASAAARHNSVLYEGRAIVYQGAGPVVAYNKGALVSNLEDLQRV